MNGVLHSELYVTEYICDNWPCEWSDPTIRHKKIPT